MYYFLTGKTQNNKLRMIENITAFLMTRNEYTVTAYYMNFAES